MKAQGLSSAQADRRLKEQGWNEIHREKARPPWRLLLEQFKSPLVLILIFASAISLFVGEGLEAAAIAAILIVNALIGFFQEYRAETAIEALQEMTAPRARVWRDGRQKEILAREIVPGDILLLEPGDIVAADARLIEASHLQAQEAVLTGESLPVDKSVSADPEGARLAERRGFVFMGTAIATGTGAAEVQATGMNTELGRIAHLLAGVKDEPTPLQTQLARIGRALLLVCLLVVLLVVVIGLVQNRPWLELLIFSLSLAVAAVPEGLPAIVTVALAVGVQRMAARNALVRKLPSVETLGSVSVICTDKTGTLTTGEMRVRETWGPDSHALLVAAASCCDADLQDDGLSGAGDPTEVAILLAAAERGIERTTIEKENPRQSSFPFDPERKRMSVFRRDGVNYVKGAVESLAAMSRESAEADKALRAAAEMGSRGLRVLAVAIGEKAEESELRIIGLIGLADPPRTEAKLAIQEARHAGITPIMITGDHPQTAIAIGRELGLLLESESAESRVHARATPEDKLNLVRQWKNQGAIVAMTGDGVNDAPALREAHIGIAMGKTGTEVTRQSADMVLADDNFATIIAAVREGRGIYENIRKAIVYLLTGNFAEIFLVVVALSLGFPLPLLAAHLLWINLVTDALPALTLIADPLSPNIMKRKPRLANESLIGESEWRRVISVGILEALLIFGLYVYVLKLEGDAAARGMAFTTLVFSQLFRAFGARSNDRVFWQVGILSNLWLLTVVILTGLVQYSLHFLPLTQKIFGLKSLSTSELSLTLTLALIPTTLIEIHKLIKTRGTAETPAPSSLDDSDAR